MEETKTQKRDVETKTTSSIKTVCVCVCSRLTVGDEMLWHMQDDSHRETAGQVGGVHQAQGAADDADEGQGGLTDGAPRGPCCWRHNRHGTR